MAPERARVPAPTAGIWLHYSPLEAGDSVMHESVPPKVARVVNVGPGGVSIERGDSLAPGTALRFWLDLGDGRIISGQGKVVWASDAHGGLSFVDLDEYARRMLRLWLQNHAPALRDH